MPSRDGKAFERKDAMFWKAMNPPYQRFACFASLNPNAPTPWNAPAWQTCSVDGCLTDSSVRRPRAEVSA